MDKNFEKGLKFVLAREGGYSNHPNDSGGETNKGITHKTYDAYRKSQGLPTRSVKDITDKEVKEIYYNNYYKASGADKVGDPKLSTVVFDTAVNMGVSRAKTMLEKSNGNVDKYLALRQEKYKEFVQAKPSQKVFLKGWQNRVKDLDNYVNSPDFNKDDSNSTTLKAGVEVNVDGNGNRIFTREEIGKMTPEEYQKNEPAIMQQMKESGIPTKSQADVKRSNSSSKSGGNSKASGGSPSGDGNWVTINGNHILLDN